MATPASLFASRAAMRALVSMSPPLEILMRMQLGFIKLKLRRAQDGKASGRRQAAGVCERKAKELRKAGN